MEYKRYKATIVSNASGKVTFTIDPTKSLRVLSCYVTIGALTSNYVRNVSIEREDGTILGEQKALYKTSEACSVVFPDSFIVPYYDPTLIFDTRTAAVSKAITIDCIYEEVAFDG